MSSQMFMEERRRVILEELQKRGRVSVRDLSLLLDVSAVTIRQDLRSLEEENLLERTHGGAVLPLPRAASPELSFDVRLRDNKGVKDTLARAAAARVKNGYSIALDASTTAFALLPFLKQLERLIIVTNSLAIAQSCLDSPQIQILMPGGQLRRDSISLVGNPDGLPKINLNIGFFGAHGIAEETGLTESSQEEVEMKHAVLARCMEAVYLLDHSKWGRVAPYTLHPPESLPDVQIMTTENAPSKMVQYFKKRGVTINVIPT